MSELPPQTPDSTVQSIGLVNTDPERRLPEGVTGEAICNHLVDLEHVAAELRGTGRGDEQAHQLLGVAMLLRQILTAGGRQDLLEALDEDKKVASARLGIRSVPLR